MKISNILDFKGREVCSVVPGTKLTEAIKKMVEKGIGSLLIMEKDKLMGIVTERDILWTANVRINDFPTLDVDEIMVTKLVSCESESNIDHAMALMTDNFTGKRIRHLPIIDDGNLMGVVSIGDIVHTLLKEMKFENRLLKNYIRNWPEEKEEKA